MDSLTRITRPNRIGRQRIDVHLRMPNQRHSLLDRLGPDESVTLGATTNLVYKDNWWSPMILE